MASYKYLALHARSISFKHPTSGEPLTFAAKVPGYFTKLVGKIEGGDSPIDPATVLPKAAQQHKR